MEILELRKSLKLSRKEFCELYDIPYITVTQWERGERTPPAYLIKLIKENIKLRTNGKQLSITEEKLYIIEYQTIYGEGKQFNCYESEYKRNRTLKCFFTDETLYKYIKTYEVDKTPI